jgi:hypothetical protein
MFNGYWNRPDETAGAVRDRWCSVGDLARRDEEAYLYIFDRRDDVIVKGGVNIQMVDASPRNGARKVWRRRLWDEHADAQPTGEPISR